MTIREELEVKISWEILAEISLSPWLAGPNNVP